MNLVICIQHLVVCSVCHSSSAAVTSQLWHQMPELKCFFGLDVFPYSDTKWNLFQIGNYSSILSKNIATNRDGIPTLNKQCRTTIDIFKRYHEVRYESEESSQERNGTDEEEEDEESSDSEREDSGIISDSSDSGDPCDFAGSMQVHCEKCNVIASNIRGQKVEEKDVGWNVLSSEIVAQLRVLINKTEKVAAEDIAVICADHKGQEYLKEELSEKLTVKGGVFSYGTLKIVGAEDYAVKCSKLQKSRKRKSNGEPSIQKKFLMIDTVRRFKGLEAEVIFVCITN